MSGLYLTSAVHRREEAWRKEAAERREEETRRNARLLKNADFRAFLDTLAFRGGFMRTGRVDCARPYEAGWRSALEDVVRRFVRADGGLAWLEEYLDKLNKKEANETGKG